MNRVRWMRLAGGAMVLAAVLAGLFLGGMIRLNTPSPGDYPVRGIDVSEFQGEIDWSRMAEQDIAFAFIRATEGSGYTDACFADNWSKVAHTGIRHGAYHFFSFDSGGDTQAANFMAAVPTGRAMLPPVVDVELYGEHRQSPPKAEAVRRELDSLLAALADHYGCEPILYVTHKTYELYIVGHYDANLIWIRDVYFTPTLSDGRAWNFWQYSDRGRLDGYRGEEKYIDLNVYAGSAADLDRLMITGRDMSALPMNRP